MNMYYTKREYDEMVKRYEKRIKTLESQVTKLEVKVKSLKKDYEVLLETATEA
jgi:prefoldin subunit 5